MHNFFLKKNQGKTAFLALFFAEFKLFLQVSSLLVLNCVPLSLSLSLQILANIPSSNRRNMLFSATMTKKVAKLQRASLNNPVKVEVSSKYQTVDKLRQHYLFIPLKHKELYLVHVLNEMQVRISNNLSRFSIDFVANAMFGFNSIVLNC